ncbi:hypothetical protein HYE82_11770 [Streptomyces sp. BR123]|uniref:VOC family protein n=1 Tax=Streptomyces sp. BR123 TaxID=2749828 RepID=UPI0015C47B85|nr:VOC family protein [Streptomyces sp. BR123]NXY95057.1 hypothetical protein [Streptomyces sp. BR123]
MTVQKMPVIALDCADPKALAQFYADLLGADVRPDPSSDGVEVVGAAGVRIACRRDAGFAPPSWLRPEDSQQAHLRIAVAAADLDGVGPSGEPYRKLRRKGDVALARHHHGPPPHSGVRVFGEQGERVRRQEAVLRDAFAEQGVWVGDGGFHRDGRKATVTEPVQDAVGQGIQREHAAQNVIRSRPIRGQPRDPLRVQSAVGFEFSQGLVTSLVRRLRHTERDLGQLIVLVHHGVILSSPTQIGPSGPSGPSPPG